MIHCYRHNVAVCMRFIYTISTNKLLFRTLQQAHRERKNGVYIMISCSCYRNNIRKSTQAIHLFRLRYRDWLTTTHKIQRIINHHKTASAASRAHCCRD